MGVSHRRKEAPSKENRYWKTLISKDIEQVKGYLRYKTIFCYKAAFDVQLMNFFIWRENNVSFSRYLGFCDFVKPTDLKICDVIIGIAS